METFREVREYLSRLEYPHVPSITRAWQMAVSVGDFRRLHDLLPKDERLFRHHRRLAEEGWKDHAKTRPCPVRIFSNEVAIEEMALNSPASCWHYYRATICEEHLEALRKRERVPRPILFSRFPTDERREQRTVIQRGLEPVVRCDAFEGRFSGTHCYFACVHDMVEPGKLFVQMSLHQSDLQVNRSVVEKLLEVPGCEVKCERGEGGVRLAFDYVLPFVPFEPHLRRVVRKDGRTRLIAEPSFCRVLHEELKSGGVSAVDDIELIPTVVGALDDRERDRRELRAGQLLVNAHDPCCTILYT